MGKVNELGYVGISSGRSRRLAGVRHRRARSRGRLRQRRRVAVPEDGRAPPPPVGAPRRGRGRRVRGVGGRQRREHAGAGRAARRRRRRGDRGRSRSSQPTGASSTSCTSSTRTAGCGWSSTTAPRSRSGRRSTRSARSPASRPRNQGLGHLVTFVSDPVAAAEFYGAGPRLRRLRLGAGAGHGSAGCVHALQHAAPLVRVLRQSAAAQADPPRDDGVHVDRRRRLGLRPRARRRPRHRDARSSPERPHVLLLLQEPGRLALRARVGRARHRSRDVAGGALQRARSPAAASGATRDCSTSCSARTHPTHATTERTHEGTRHAHFRRRHRTARAAAERAQGRGRAPHRRRLARPRRGDAPRQADDRRRCVRHRTLRHDR